MRFLVATVALALVLVAPARAATVSVSGDTLRVVAAPGEANAVTVTDLGVEDYGGAPLVAGAGCVGGGPAGPVHCLAPVARVEIGGGGGGDTLSIAALLPAPLRGGGGNERAQGGPRGARLHRGR